MSRAPDAGVRRTVWWRSIAQWPLAGESLAFLSVWVLFVVALAAAVALTLTRWRNLEMSYFDFGYFDQIVWNTSRGRWFESSFTPYNFLAQHFQPILLPFALAYRLGAGPLFLTVAQSTVALAAVFPLFGAATRLGLRPALAALIASTFVLNAYLHRTLNYDFHPEVMVALPAFVSAWLMVGGRRWSAAVVALTTLLFKEDAVFVALALAALLWWQGGKREAVVTAAAALLWTVALMLVLMPMGREGYESNVIGRYDHVFGSSDAAGAGPFDLLLVPWRAAAALLVPDRWLTAGLFVLGVGPLALARPWTLLLVLPGLAAVLLSMHPPQHSLELHYGAVLLPVGVLAGLVGAARLARLWPARVVAACALVPVLLVSVALSPLFDPSDRQPPTAQHRAAVEAALALIPPDDSVAAQSHLGPRLSRREKLTEFPGGWRDADWVVVDEYGHRGSQSVEAGFAEALREVRGTYTRVFDRDGVEVFRRAP